MDQITLEEYLKAKQIVEDYKVCGNWNRRKSGHGCNHVFKTKDLIRTDQYGQTYYWCPKCYEGIKDD
jgi:hypothetical protein